MKDEDMNVISGLPFPGRVLGRPSASTQVPKIALVGSALGRCFGLFLLYGTAALYPLQVGGQPLFPVPMGFITTFEMAMLGLMGMCLPRACSWTAAFPRTRPRTTYRRSATARSPCSSSAIGRMSRSSSTA